MYSRDYVWFHTHAYIRTYVQIQIYTYTRTSVHSCIPRKGLFFKCNVDFFWRDAWLFWNNSGLFWRNIGLFCWNLLEKCWALLVWVQCEAFWREYRALLSHTSGHYQEQWHPSQTPLQNFFSRYSKFWREYRALLSHTSGHYQDQWYTSQTPLQNFYSLRTVNFGGNTGLFCCIPVDIIRTNDIHRKLLCRIFIL